MILYIYLLGVVVTFFPFTRMIWRAMREDEFASDVDNSFDRAFDMVVAIFFAACGAVLWPLCIFVYLARQFLFPQTLAEREAELNKREQRIADLEREAGIQ